MERDNLRKALAVLNKAKITIKKKNEIQLNPAFIKVIGVNDEQNPKTQILENAHIVILSIYKAMPEEDMLDAMSTLSVILEDYGIQDASDMLDIFA